MKGIGFELGKSLGPLGIAAAVGAGIMMAANASDAMGFNDAFSSRQQFRVSSSHVEEEEEEEKKRKLKDVVVIGCGAAGIAALSKLQDAGLDVVGLEAASRIGGRIRTIPFADGVVDLGAAWCHGETGNKVFELANPHDLLGRPGKEEVWYIFSNGTLMPNGNANTIVNEFKDAERDANGIDKRSISKCIDEKVGRKSIVDPGRIPITAPFIEWYKRDNHLGGQVDPKEGKSLRNLVENETCRGEFWLNWKGKGYKTILDVLLKKYPHSSKSEPEIFLNTKVNSVIWQLEDDTNDNKPYVKVIANNMTIETKCVIITVSIGVLKESHSKLFMPMLEPEKISCIDNIGFCVLDKIYIEFASTWWGHSPANFNVIWKQEDKNDFSEIDQWVTEIYGLRTVEHQPNVLLAWIYGEGAKKMEGKDDHEVKSGIEKFMQHVFSLNFKVSAIKGIIRSQWSRDPLVRGSYSYRSVATEEAEASAAGLKKPLNFKGKAVVYFAGEATSEKHYNSVHGAIESGFQAAEDVMRAPPF
ncbi:probable polyamine oxidase 5 isoform X1 [Ostrinia furnacalis]|uniref:probable polyamine oxidase 5 isoform X1 n=1 Tax=Ostrinia furnacalis TaxID=93504 RepID=UPI00103C3F9D|nr:probable polyamine oxidase 5 isoform X1 [Ostrinia furnacalis]